MADIRCEKCQTLNPANATVCKNCGQPLADDSISWLDSLRSDTASSSPEEPETPSNATEDIQPEEIPDWLQRIRQRSQEEKPPAEPSEPATGSAEELPDWLRDIQQSSSKPSSGSDADWLQSLRSTESGAAQADSLPDEPEAASNAPFEGAPSAGSDADTPDWLKNLETWKSEKGQQSSATGQPLAMDWSGAENDSTSSSPSDEIDQDWLQRLSQQSGSQPASEEPNKGAETPLEPAAPAAQSAADASDMDWLANLQATSGMPPAEPADEEPAAAPTESSDMDWLAGLQSAAEPASEELPAEEQPASANADFDWMSRLSGGTPPAEEQSESGQGSESAAGFSWESEIPSQEPSAEGQSETPDWLRAYGAHQPDDQSPAEKESPFSAPLPENGESGQDAGELPDWLSKFSAQEPEVTPAETQPAFDSTEEPKPTGPEDVPAWLSSFPSQTPAEPAGEPQPAAEFTDEPQPGQPENVPDWLKQVPAAEPAAQPPAEPVVPISEEPQNENFTWQSLGLQAESGADKAEEASSDLPFAGANLPEWLDQAGEGEPRLPLDEELIPPAKSDSEPEPSTPFAQAGIPDWLGESAPAGAAARAGEELPAESSDQPLEAAELPTWLQSMRPIETVAPKPISAEEKRVEKAGPLAGITGVLPTEDLVGQYIKPPLYTVKLRVSEKQRVHASLIESLIGEETQPQAIPPERSEAPKRILRFLVAAILIVAILLPMLNILPSFPASDMLPQELIAFQQVMSDEAILPQGSAVLLALEYEPGLSGEMQTASEAVIRQLAEKNVRLTVISTSPTGPILAESLLAKAKFDPANVVNLGYLAGGSTGLQSFGLAPVQAAPATLQGQLAPWNSGALANVTKLSDFAATIVLTDDPDKGRTWVEQIQPTLAGKPMLMVSSAQAAPLLLPYYNSGQVKGILSGINGAAGYESLVDSAGTATLLRGSYQYGMLLAALLILVGGLLTAISSSINRGKAEKEA